MKKWIFLDSYILDANHFNVFYVENRPGVNGQFLVRTFIIYAGRLEILGQQKKLTI